MKKLFYNILISVCLIHFCGMIYKINASEVQIELMNAEQLNIKENTVNTLLKKSSKKSTATNLYEQQLEAIKKRRTELEKQRKKEQSSLLGATKKFKEQAMAVHEKTKEKTQQSKAQSEYPLENIQNIQKLIATSDKLFVLHKDQDSVTSPLKLAQIDQNKDFSKMDIENPTVPELSDPEEKITWLEESAQSFCDIASYKNTYAYGYFFKQKTRGPFQSDMSMIDFVDAEGNKYPATNTHKTLIKSLFLDDQFIVSHSKAGNIRFIPINELKNEQKESLERTIEYKAERLVAYKHKCMIYEKSSLLSGIALYVAYIDENAEIVAEKKIGSYQKGDESPFLAAINEKGEALIYDQHHRSLTACSKKENKINEQKYKYAELPKQLKYRVAQQIHYVNDKAIVVYDDQIYEISSIGVKKLQSKPIFHIRSSAKEKVKAVAKSLRQPNEPFKSFKTIVSTAMQNNERLWIISSKEFDAQEEQPTIEYSIQKVSLGAAK